MKAWQAWQVYTELEAVGRRVSMAHLLLRALKRMPLIDIIFVSIYLVLTVLGIILGLGILLVNADIVGYLVLLIVMSTFIPLLEQHIERAFKHRHPHSYSLGNRFIIKSRRDLRKVLVMALSSRAIIGRLSPLSPQVTGLLVDLNELYKPVPWFRQVLSHPLIAALIAILAGLLAAITAELNKAGLEIEVMMFGAGVLFLLITTCILYLWGPSTADRGYLERKEFLLCMTCSLEQPGRH